MSDADLRRLIDKQIREWTLDDNARIGKDRQLVGNNFIMLSDRIVSAIGALRPAISTLQQPIGDGELSEAVGRVLTKLENAVEHSVAARMNGRTMNNRMTHANAMTELSDLIAVHLQAAVREAEQRGAAFAICNLSFKTAMDERKTVAESWLATKGEQWAIDSVKYHQSNDMPVIGYNQNAAKLNAEHEMQQLKQTSETKEEKTYE